MSEVVVHELRPLHHRQREGRVGLVDVNEDRVADVSYAGQGRAVRGTSAEGYHTWGQEGTHVTMSFRVHWLNTLTRIHPNR